MLLLRIGSYSYILTRPNQLKVLIIVFFIIFSSLPQVPCHSKQDAETAIQTEALKLIANIIEDLRKTSKINDERKQELINKVKKLGDRLIRVQTDFKKSTITMIDELLNDSNIDRSIACIEENIEKRKHYYKRYQRQLDSAMIRSEALAQSVQSILVLIVEKDPKLSVKYKIFLTTTIIIPIFGAGAIVGLAAAHLIPAAVCTFSLGTGGIAALAIGSGIIVLITAWLIYKTIQSKRFDWKARMGEISEAFRDILRKYFPYLESFFCEGDKKKMTEDQLKQSVQQELQCLAVDESTWLYNDSLNDFRNEMERTLNDLNEDHDVLEESYSSAA
jgi:hypothetical protein